MRNSMETIISKTTNMDRSPHKEITYEIRQDCESDMADILYQFMRNSMFSPELVDYLNSRISSLQQRSGREYESVIEEIKSFYTSHPAFQSGELGEIACKVFFLQMEGKRIYPEKDWGMRDNPKLAKRGVDVLAFRFYPNEMDDEVFVTETKTSATLSALEKALYGDGGVIDWLANKLTPGIFLREINKVLNHMPIDDSNRTRVSKFMELFDEPGKLKRAGFLVVQPDILTEEHKSNIFALAKEGQAVYLYVLSCDKFAEIRKNVFDRFEVREDGSAL